MGIDRKAITYSFVILFVWGFFHPLLNAQNVRIGLFDNRSVNTFVFNCTEGVYRVFGDSSLYRTINKDELVYISLKDGQLVIMDGDLNFSSFRRLEIKESATNSSFRLKLVDPAFEPRNYKGDLEISLFFNSVQIINELSMDEYIAGVVEAEGGPAALPEYYKAQAILCRSYALKNWGNHPGQSFNLCDDTHCQAFHGISDENPAIHDAVLFTHGLVLTDQNKKIVSAIFHSNSGGETQRASDVWNGGEEYLQAVIDPFSIGLRSANWKKTIGLEEWRQYLAKRITTDINKIDNESLLIKQAHRKKFFVVDTDSLLLVGIRNDLQLRSSFFSMELHNDSILISGKGYGHGVGMSQEGAMEMARQGYSYSDILMFYFDNVRVIEMDEVSDALNLIY